MTQEIPQQLLTRFATGEARVERVEHEGRVIWVKRAEKLQGRMRLQKGDPAQAFADERRAYHDLRLKGAPVPQLAAEGERFFATYDSGPTLRDLAGLGAPVEILRTASADAAGALADLHARGLVHGRPAMKDICWDDGRVTFLDFERTARIKATQSSMAMDLILLLTSAAGEARITTDILDAMSAAYRTGDRKDVWDRARSRISRLRWARPALRMVARMKPRNKEIRGALRIFEVFGF